MPAYSLSLHMLQDFSPQGSRDETGQEVITLQVTAQQQVTVQEGQEKKVSFRINFQKQYTITWVEITRMQSHTTVTFSSRRL